jgi:hypothetical protein
MRRLRVGVTECTQNPMPLPLPRMGNRRAWCTHTHVRMPPHPVRRGTKQGEGVLGCMCSPTAPHVGRRPFCSSGITLGARPGACPCSPASPTLGCSRGRHGQGMDTQRKCLRHLRTFRFFEGGHLFPPRTSKPPGMASLCEIMPRGAYICRVMP